MDTLEFELFGTNTGPVLWRNKTPQELYREKYSEYHLNKESTAPRSLSNDAQQCDTYAVRGRGESGSTTYRATLIPIPEKP